MEVFDDRPYIDETLPNEFSGQVEDIEKLKKLKQVSQKFIKINDFDLGEEPLMENLSLDQFKDYIETTSKESIIASKLDESNVDLTLRSLMSNLYEHKSKLDHRIFIYFLPDSKKIGAKDLQNFIALILKLGCKEGLLISTKELSAKAKDKVRQCNIQQGNYENIYQIINYKDDDFIDITSHAFSPEVVKLFRGKEEIEQFASENRINVKSLPRIWIDDPLSKFYRARVGDIFQFKRKHISSRSLLEEQISFSIVVPARNKK